jgi:AcrR family transcriptional regulator
MTTERTSRAEPRSGVAAAPAGASRSKGRTVRAPSGSRPALDRDSVVTATLELVATPGVGSLSFRKLGAAMGVDPTAFYRHFVDRDDLMCACLDRLESESVAAVDRAAPWDDRLRTLATATFERCRRFPAVGVEMAQHTTSGPGERGTIEVILEAMADAGLRDDDVVRLYGMYTNYVLSAAGAAGAHVLAGTHIGLPEDQAWLGGLGDLDAQTHPLMHRHRDRLEQLMLPQMYASGVEVILDAVRAVVAGYRRGR